MRQLQDLQIYNQWFWFQFDFIKGSSRNVIFLSVLQSNQLQYNSQLTAHWVFFFLWQIGQFAEKRMWVEDHVWDRWWSCRPAGWGTWRAWGWERSSAAVCFLLGRGVGTCIVEDRVLFFLIHSIKFLFRQETFLQGSLTEVVTMIRKHRLRAAASPVATISPIAIVNASKIGISKILVAS